MKYTILTSVLLVTILFTLCIPNEKYVETFSNKENKVDTFTIDKFILEIIKDSIKEPEVVIKQACLETSHFKSRIFKEYNNCFGFYYKGDYIKFTDWKSSISYYKKWQDKHYKGGDYYDFLERVGYSEDSSYCKTLKYVKY